MQAAKEFSGKKPQRIPLVEVDKQPRIANQFHFIWFGSTLPDFAVIAIRSALACNPGSKATLWHSENFSIGGEVRLLSSQGLSTERIDIGSLLKETSELDPRLDTASLLKIYSRLSQPAALANVVRMLVLYTRGGIYLDTDTLTVKDMTPLRGCGAFCGKERILWPQGRAKLDPRAVSLAELRRMLSWLPGGFRAQKRFDRFYSLAENNAVLGAAKRHPLIREMLVRMLQVPERDWTKRFRLGTHLLQETLRDLEAHGSLGEFDIRVFEPAYFYPVGPKMSLHYFRAYGDAGKVSRELVPEQTFVIHWYASVANLLSLDYAHIRETSKRSVYAYLCAPYVPAFMPALRPLPAPGSVGGHAFG